VRKIPIILFAVMALLFVTLLLKGKDPSVIESVMIGRPAPPIDLPAAIQGDEKLSSRSMPKTPRVVNVFASWCVPCQLEQGILEEIGRAEDVPVYGINYKDNTGKLAAWLEKYGDPYTAIGADADGRAAVEWGVAGVPETFIVDADGVIRYKHIGVVTGDDYHNIFKPILKELKK
jgi:cytochrome c biogenesis protein CcmG/thiol:disulfide interchange protein DsbE